MCYSGSILFQYETHDCDFVTCDFVTFWCFLKNKGRKPYYYIINLLYNNMKIFIYNYVFYSFFCLTYKNIAKRPASQRPNVPFSDFAVEIFGRARFYVYLCIT